MIDTTALFTLPRASVTDPTVGEPAPRADRPLAELAPSPHRASSSTRLAILHPVSLTALLLAICASALIAGALIAGVIGAVLALPTAAGAVVGLASLAPVQRAAVRYRNAREHQARERERLAHLLPAGPARQQEYRELREIVDQVEHAAPDDASRYDLEQLLDDYVQLAFDYERYQRAVLNAAALSDESAKGGTDRPTRAKEIIARRIRHREECKHRCEHLADQLDAIDQLVRLVAQRATCPPIDEDLDREIDRRLWELEEVDAALAQLSVDPRDSLGTPTAA